MFDPLDVETLRNPYPEYARLRRESPILYLPQYRVWVVSRYDDVVAVLRDPTRFSSTVGMSPDFRRAGSGLTGVDFRIGAPGVRVLIATDPPEHTAFRRAVSAAFSPGAIARLGDRIEATAVELVDGLLARSERGEADFYRDVAEPLPALVLAEMLGVPRDMRVEFRRWAREVTSDLEARRADATPQLGRGLAMFRYFASELRKRRRSQSDDLFGVLAHAGSAGMSEYEIYAFCAFLLVAGIETTTNLLTNLVAALLRFDDAHRALRDDPSLINPAIEEALRYDSPIQALWRGTVDDTEVGGHQVPAGARLLVLFGSANRDESRFDDPDRFVVDRRPTDHIAFGAGAHYCLGAHLARAEVRAVLGQLLGRTKDMRPLAEPELSESFVFRGAVTQCLELVPA